MYIQTLYVPQKGTPRTSLRRGKQLLVLVPPTSTSYLL